MNKHTPGPWANAGQIGKGHWIVAEPGRDQIAVVYGPGVNVASEGNARLIAAAPDLLTLLKRYRSETPLGHQPSMIAAEADSVIAKAEGRPLTSTRGTE